MVLQFARMSQWCQIGVRGMVLVSPGESVDGHHTLEAELPDVLNVPHHVGAPGICYNNVHIKKSI